MTRAKPELPERIELRLGLDEPEEEEWLRTKAGRQLGVDGTDLPPLTVSRRSIDARGSSVRIHLTLTLGSAQTVPIGPLPRQVDRPERVIIVGDGPAGLFCAYALARAGIGSTVLDRGKPVQPRRHDLKALNRFGLVNPDSNYCYGEGGAGTYSDGKLYTRSHKRGNVRDVLEILAVHGAPPSILTDARPHVGSNRLPKVVTALRERLEGLGVRFRFEARVVELLIERQGGRASCVGVRLADGVELLAERIVLATGHSARDIFEMLTRARVGLVAKAFALGVRVEHPQPLIDRLQYGKLAGHPRLPPAAYQLTATSGGRGVFSFCMCPGGFIVPAATEPDGVVLNGMSLSKRNSRYANAGIVVQVTEEDLRNAGHPGPLGGVEFQRHIERAAFEAGGGSLRAPATRLTDFVRSRPSTTLPGASYLPGMTASDVGTVFDSSGLPLAARLRQAFGVFGSKVRGFLTEEAVVSAVESRTSAPVRVLRHPCSWESPDLGRLYPCGEGAGHAGGIVSAALDGMAVAERLKASLLE